MVCGHGLGASRQAYASRLLPCLRHYYTIQSPFIHLTNTFCCSCVKRRSAISVGQREPDGEKADTIQVVVLIGDEVKMWRMRRAMTQAELAEKAGVGVNTVVRIERNQTEPRPPTIRKLAQALRIDTSELVQ